MYNENGISNVLFVDKIKEVGVALDNGLYNAALALCLTIPDICAWVRKEVEAKSNGKVNGEDYEKWFSDFVSPHLCFPDCVIKYNGSQIVKPAFNGYTCWLLRCAFLHNGNSDINSKKKTTIKKVCFEYNKDNPSHHINGVIVDENGRIDITMDLDSLCRCICIGAMNFYRSGNEDVKKMLNEKCVIYIMEI